MSWFRRDKPKIEEQEFDEERKVKTDGIFVGWLALRMEAGWEQKCFVMCGTRFG